MFFLVVNAPYLVYTTLFWMLATVRDVKMIFQKLIFKIIRIKRISAKNNILVVFKDFNHYCYYIFYERKLHFDPSLETLYNYLQVIIFSAICQKHCI